VFAELLLERIGSVTVLSRSQIEQLEKHFDLLNRWNRVLNLTSLSTPEEIVERHYCESLFLASHLPEGYFRAADIGSGAGFPGIPLAISRRDCFVALIESHQRKCVFLREATRSQVNTQVIASRANEVTDRFDFAVSRAVRFSEIERSMARLASNLAILGGTEAPSTKCFTWNASIVVPWGNQRRLWLGIRRRST